MEKPSLSSRFYSLINSLHIPGLPLISSWRDLAAVALGILKAIPRSPANYLTLLILLAGLGVTILRFTLGLGGVTNLDDANPWGLWIGFDLLCGVALAAGGYTASAACYLFGLKRFHAAVRPAITTAFLGYAFVVLALHYDVGQPWRLVYPIFISQGASSILFEVGLCVFTYLCVLFIEWSVAPLEWLGWKKLHAYAAKLVLPLTILGVILSTMHQSSLGALFLVSPGKLHPLWYSPFLPVFFFVSSIFAGLSMVIFEGSLAHAALRKHMDEEHLSSAAEIALGFGKAASFLMIAYFCMRVFDLAMNNNRAYLLSGYGLLWLLELGGLTAFPAFLFTMGYRERKLRLVRLAAILAIAGIILNRLNVCLIAFNWQLPAAERYFPSLFEFVISIFIVTCIITAYRIFASFLPILHGHEAYETKAEGPGEAEPHQKNT